MSESKLFAEGSVIFKEKSWELAMYDIVSGKVGIYSAYGTENETLLTELSAGEFFGEMGLIDAMPRSATAVALENTVCKYINADDFDAYLTDNPGKVMEIYQNLCSRLVELSNQYIESCKTVSEYVDAQNSGKRGRKLLDKIAKLINDGLYYAQYDELMLEAFDNMDFTTMSNRFEMFRM